MARPVTARAAPIGRASLRITNGFKTAFGHLRTGEACIGRSTAAVEWGGPRQVYLRYTRPQTATIAPTGRTSLRISNGLETAFRPLHPGEAFIGRSDGGC
eukprot:scaffold60497_cov78-Phaeocystis_antarctica.AAC.2